MRQEAKVATACGWGLVLLIALAWCVQARASDEITIAGGFISNELRFSSETSAALVIQSSNDLVRDRFRLDGELIASPAQADGIDDGEVFDGSLIALVRPGGALWLGGGVSAKRVDLEFFGETFTEPVFAIGITKSKYELMATWRDLAGPASAAGLGDTLRLQVRARMGALVVSSSYWLSGFDGGRGERTGYMVEFGWSKRYRKAWGSF